MDCAIVFISIFQLALEMNFSFHPNTLLVTHSWNSLNMVVLPLPPTIDKPKYFSLSVIILAPSKLLIISQVSCLVFRLKKRDVFCRLMAYSEANSY